MIEYALWAIVFGGLFVMGYIAGKGPSHPSPPHDDGGCCLRVPDDPSELFEDAQR